MSFVGQVKIMKLFDRLVEDGSLSHAYIFVGSEHVGKTTAALEIAAKILKTNSGAVTHHPDLRLISRQYDEKKERLHRDILTNDIRTVLRFAQESSFQGGAKVIIISEADRLNEESHAVLLKTLEEPTAQTYLFLLYQTLAAIPVTIRSRCQVFNFTPVSEVELTVALSEWGVIDSAQTEIIKLSRGLPGLALSLINDPEVLKNFKADRQLIFSLLKSDLVTRFKAIEPWLEAAKDDGGVDELVRHLEIWQSALTPTACLQEWAETGRAWANLTEIHDCIRMTIKALRQNAHPKLTLEALLVKLSV